MIEVLKQALDALEQWNTPLYKRGNVITSLRQAIAEAEKQVTYTGNGSAGRENMTAPTGFFFQMPKREWIGLTDEELDSYREQRWWSAVDMAKEVEAKLKEKNT